MEKSEQFVKYNCGNLLTGCYLFCLRGFYQEGSWGGANYCGISRGSGRPPSDKQEKVSFKVCESQEVGDLPNSDSGPAGVQWGWSLHFSGAPGDAGMLIPVLL